MGIPKINHGPPTNAYSVTEGFFGDFGLLCPTPNDPPGSVYVTDIDGMVFRYVGKEEMNDFQGICNASLYYERAKRMAKPCPLGCCDQKYHWHSHVLCGTHD